MKISVILPSLNVRSYIEQCLLSVVNQTLYDIEIICVDAGSTDGTLEIIENIAHKDNRIRVLNSTKKSYGYQVNLGIRESSGEYIAVVETDDYIKPQMYEVLYNKAEEYKLDYVKGSFSQILYNDSGRVYRIDSYIFSNKGTSLYNRPINIKENPDIILRDSSIWSGIYKKSFLLENDIWLNESSGASYQDIGFVTQTIMLAKNVLYVDEPFYQYRVNRPGCSTFNMNVLKNCRQEWERLFDNIFVQKKIKLTNELLERLQVTIVGETDKLLDILNYNYMDDYINQNLQPLLDIVYNCCEKYGFKMLDSISKMSNSMEDYSKGIRTQKQLCEEKEILLLEQARNSSGVSIFGAGKLGVRAYELMCKNKIKVFDIYDNSKVGEKFAGLIIKSAIDLKNKKTDELIIVANKFSCAEIKKQLIYMGIEPGRIIEFNY